MFTLRELAKAMRRRLQSRRPVPLLEAICNRPSYI